MVGLPVISQRVKFYSKLKAVSKLLGAIRASVDFFLELFSVSYNLNMMKCIEEGGDEAIMCSESLCWLLDC
jgi:hypothetical protein